MPDEHLNEAITEELAFTKLASTGPTRWGGIVSEEFLTELRWPQAYEVYDEMRKSSPVVGGFLRAVKSGFLSTKFHPLKYDDSEEAVFRAAFLQENLEDMRRPMSAVMSDILTMLPFGFSVLEQCFKMRLGPTEGAQPSSKYADGMIGWDDWALIPQNTVMEWIYDLPMHPDRLIGIRQLALGEVPPGTSPVIDIPMTKALHFRVDSEKDNPEGVSLLRTGYRPYYFMTNLEVVEAIAIERTGCGIPVIGLPESASAGSNDPNSDESKALKIVKQIRTDEQGGIVKPAGWTFDLVYPTGLRPEIFDLSIKRHRSNLLMSVLAVFLELGTARVGSFATSETGRSFFEMAFEGLVMAVEDVINNHAIPLLFKLNGITDNRLPKIGHVSLAGTNLETMITAVEKLAKVGMLDSTPDLKEYIESLLRVPRGSTIVEREAIRSPNATSTPEQGLGLTGDPGVAGDLVAPAPGPESSNGHGLGDIGALAGGEGPLPL